MKTIYHYDPITKLFTHSEEVPDGVHIEFSTDKKPPKKLKAPAFVMGKWVEHTNDVVKITPHIISKIDFMNLFTQAELEAIYTAAKQNVTLEVWVKKLDAAKEIDLNSQDTINGIQALVAAKLLTAGRDKEILSGTNPNTNNMPGMI